MGSYNHPTHGVYEGAVLDVDRHAGNEAPVGEISKPELGKIFELNNAVANGRGFPIFGTFNPNLYSLILV